MTMKKEWNNKKNRKGFTLAELLIVVSIIAVLVAISIPLFAAHLEKSREATDLANVRGIYAEVMASAISDDKDSPEYVEGVGYVRIVSLKQKKEGWQTKGELVIGEVTSSDTEHWIGTPSAGGICTVSIPENGDMVTIVWGKGTNDDGGNDDNPHQYENQKVTDSIGDYEDPLNKVLSTLYNELVAPRLGQDFGQIAYVQFNDGKVTAVNAYSEKDNPRTPGGQAIKSEIDLPGLNQKISDALAGTGYSVAGTCRIFFDKNGKCISNYSNGEKLMIGGQGTGASIKFVKDKVGKTLYYNDDAIGWYK